MFGGNMSRYMVWECKIVVDADTILPSGFDSPPRRAAIDAVNNAGIDIKACYSGWGGSLTKFEEEGLDE
jgi:hypothetical protein